MCPVWPLPFGIGADLRLEIALSGGFSSGGSRLSRCRAIARLAGWVSASKAGGKTSMPLDLPTTRTSTDDSSGRDACLLCPNIWAACSDMLMPAR